MKIEPVVAFLFICCLSTAPGFAGEVTFLDSAFHDSDWSAEIMHDGTPDSSAFFTAFQEATGGNPGAHRHVFHSWCGDGIGSSTIWVAHMRDGAVYNPAESGAISSIDCSFDAQFCPVVNPNAVGCGLLLYQNGYYYRASGVIQLCQWTQLSFSELVSTDFNLVPDEPGPPNPDFSESAGPILFGFYTSNGTSGADCLTSNSYYDNWSVVITHGPPASVDPDQQSAAACWLGPCQPNPFTLSTRIRFRLPRTMNARVDVYSVSGRLIATLTGESWPEGVHGVDWDGCDNSGRQMPPGVYMCRLRAGSYAEARRIVLVR